MKRDGLNHPKLRDLAATLGIPRVQAIGHLELLWDFTATHAPRGDVGRFSDGAIAGSVDWTGDPTAFVVALARCGWLDADETYRYLVHKWPEHAPRWVVSKLAKGKDGVARSTDATALASTHAPVQSSLVKSSQVLEKTGAEPSGSLPIIGLPTNTGDDFEVTQEQVAEWSRLYPAVDVPQALRSMRGWLLANTAKRKTARGMLRFVNRWLSAEQDKGGKPNGSARLSAVERVKLATGLTSSALPAIEGEVRRVK